MSTNTLQQHLRAWATPGLLLIVSYFVKTKLEEIDSKLDDIVNLKVRVSVLESKAITDEENLFQLTERVNLHLEQIPAKKEDEITLKNLNK